MAMTFTQRIAGPLHLGRISRDARGQLDADGGAAYLAEGVLESAIMRHFRARGQRCNYRKSAFIGYCAISRRRLMARARFVNHMVNVNIAFDDPKFSRLAFRAEPKYLSVTFDAADHLPDASGSVEVRLHLPDVREAATLLEKHGACVSK